MPKLGMRPIRREQICRAATSLIARHGFAGTTMRMVAVEAGVSTGMINHYFENREDLLQHALVYVSDRSRRRYEDAIAAQPPGTGRLEALLDSVLSDDDEAQETWWVWIAAYGEAVRVPSLRRTIADRLDEWFELVDRALGGIVADVTPPGEVRWAWRVDALLTGLATQALTSEAELPARLIRDEVVRMVRAGAALESVTPAKLAEAAR